jgi:bacteriophage N4 adsorption protein B
MWFPDRLALELLAPLAVWVLASGLDDLVIDLSWFWVVLQSARGKALSKEGLSERQQGEPLVAVVAPCWREDAVLEQMIQRNLQSIRYGNYDIWIGLYPNDRQSLSAVQRASRLSEKVHWAVGSRPGPTTKADNVNQLIRGILARERRTGVRYEAFLFHDAEDVIHPLELSEATRLLRRFHMVQLPVLPLATPAWALTHGVYADEFAEFHGKDLRVRAAFGGFIPSAGVATALRREVIERLRILRGDEVFNPHSLTEDYFLGLEVQQLGLRQAFSFSLDRGSREIIASRSYFPRTFRTAVRQRARWIAGNNLQAWERFGWRLSPRQLYWLWRDRKGLLNQVPGLLAAALFLFGLARWLWSGFTGSPWIIGDEISRRPVLWTALWLNGGLVLWRLAARAGFGWSVYGWRHAVLAPIRMPWAGVINFCASWMALRAFFQAKSRKRPLSWAKTTHSYPQAAGSETSRSV